LLLAELVLATNLLPKRQRPYQVLNVGLTDRFGIEWVSEALGDAHKSAALGVRRCSIDQVL
jgi:hypothetical protein